MSATFPKTVTVRGIPGITAKIYRQRQTKGDAKYTNYTVAYSLLGKLKRETFANLEKAEEVGQEAIKKIARGEQAVLQLKSQDRDIYQRSVDALARHKVPLDVAATTYAEMLDVLNGTGSPIEAARLFVKVHNKELPRITVPAAVEKCLAQCRADGKSDARMHQLEQYLNAFAADMNIEVGEVTPGIVSKHLTSMTASERTKKNARDVLGYFGRWCVLHGYLERGTDLTEGVQRYSMKPGTIEVFTPAEMSKLIEHADVRLLPTSSLPDFLAYGAPRSSGSTGLSWILLTASLK